MITENLLAVLRGLAVEVEADAVVLWKKIKSSSEAYVMAALPVELLAIGTPWPLVEPPDSEPVVERSQERLGNFIPTSLRLRLTAPPRAALAVKLDTNGIAMLIVWCAVDPHDSASRTVMQRLEKDLVTVATDWDHHQQTEARAIRLDAAVSALEQAVITIDDVRMVGYVNNAAATLLSLPEGEVAAPLLAKALGDLQNRAVNSSEVYAAAAQLVLNPQAAIHDSLWSFSRSPTHLRVSTTPYRQDDTWGRIWVFDDVSTLREATETAEKARVAEAEAREAAAAAYKIIADDLKAAARVQRSLIPQKITNLRGITCDWLFLPSQFVAGDIFNIFQIDETTLAYYLLDVSGHGISSALLSTTLSSVLKPSPNFSDPMRRSLPLPPYYEIVPSREVVRELNERFMNDGMYAQYFTMIYGTLDIATGSGLLTQAGHPSPIHQAADGTVRLIGDGGFPVGMLCDAEYDEHQVVLMPGERLFLYSDGITECLNHEGEMFGEGRLLEVIRKGRAASLHDVIEMIERELTCFSNETCFDDDLSLLAIERRTEG